MQTRTVHLLTFRLLTGDLGYRSTAVRPASPCAFQPPLLLLLPPLPAAKAAVAANLQQRQQRPMLLLLSCCIPAG
jgi:hypothetical protein